MSEGSDFERRWRQRFMERGRLFEADAAIAGWSPSGLAARLRNFRALWPGDRPGARWLDIGCGAGSYSRLLHEQGIDTLGLDYSLPSVRKARARSGEGIGWLVADARALPLADACLDGVLCFGVLQALSDPEPVIEEALRVLRPGGELWIDALNLWCLPTLARLLWLRLGRRAPGLRHDRPGRLLDLLRQRGALEVRLDWVPILPARWQRWQPWLERPLARALLRRLPGLGALLSHAVLVRARRAHAKEAPGRHGSERHTSA
ncbi:MAG: class I SAM-dependent methyltransferase [Chromatiaceae bacterium]|nr:class I SAM-dependent methyltransferase [Chromatiaceae bacterium]